MSETLPLSTILSLGGAFVSVVGYVVGLHWQLHHLKGDLTRLQTQITAHDASLNGIDRRLSLCENTHTMFEAEYRRDIARVGRDLDIVGMMKRILRLQERGHVVPLTDIGEES